MSPRSVLRVRPRSLRGPILAALALIASVVAGMFATLLVTVHSLETVSKAQRRTSAMTQSTQQLERTVVDLETGVRGFMLTDDLEFLEPYDRGRRRIARLTAELRGNSTPELRVTVERISSDLGDYVSDYTEPLVHG